MASSVDKRLVRSSSGLRIVPVNNAHRSPFVVEEPQWIPDRQCNSCKACLQAFDFFQRRHHCRRCGQCFCAKCCGAKVLLPRMCFVDPVLHCSDCASVTNRENEFFEVQIKTLLQGAQFNVEGSVFGEDIKLLLCKLTQDHRFIVFDAARGPSPFISHDPVELKRIQKVEMLPATKEIPEGGGSTLPSGVEIAYKDTEEQNLTMKFTVAEGTSATKKQAVVWLVALIKV